MKHLYLTIALFVLLLSASLVMGEVGFAPHPDYSRACTKTKGTCNYSTVSGPARTRESVRYQASAVGSMYLNSTSNPAWPVAANTLVVDSVNVDTSKLIFAINSSATPTTVRYQGM